jgi:hypothetical protein
LLGKPLLPAPDHRSADAKLLGDLLHRTIERFQADWK